MLDPTQGVLIVLLAVVIFRRYTVKSITPALFALSSISVANSSPSTTFRAFQWSYTLVAVIMLTAEFAISVVVYDDMCNGRGYSTYKVVVLYICGAGASLVGSTALCSQADFWGKKKAIVMYAIATSTSLLTKNSSNMMLHGFASALAGMASASLYSALESWMVTEHHSHGHREEWMTSTFTLCIKSYVTIGALTAFIANGTRSVLGSLIPLNILVSSLIISAFIVMSWGREAACVDLVNAGSCTDAHMGTRVFNGFHKMITMIGQTRDRLITDPRMVLLCVTQVCLESSLYLFTYLWAPALGSTTTADIGHPWVFACLSVCQWLGSDLLQSLFDIGGYSHMEASTPRVFLLGSGALLTSAFFQQQYIRLVCFMVFQLCCGFIIPCLGLGRARYLPEDLRTTVMNLSHAPRVILYCFIFSNIDNLGDFTAHFWCASLMFLGFISYSRLALLCNSADGDVLRHRRRRSYDSMDPHDDDSDSGYNHDPTPSA